MNSKEKLSERAEPLLVEVGFVALYIGLWLFPVAASCAVSLTGRAYSMVGTKWQLVNTEIVFYNVSAAFFAGMVSAIIFTKIFSERLVLLISSVERVGFCRTQQLATILLALLTAIGLFKSHGGIISGDNYNGPITPWLGYGAWGVTNSMAILLLVGELIRRKSGFVVILAVIFLGALPVLACGSRIDYMSLMLAWLAYNFIGRDIVYRTERLLATGMLMLLVGVSVHYLRYRGFSLPSGLEKLTPVGEYTNASMLYMSTIGDIGASFFQVVGLIHSETITPIDIEYALKGYLQRLLPGPLFSNRPSDLATLLPEQIGGGALHSLGEGYLIGVGVIPMGILFGCLASLSIIFGRQLNNTFTPVLFLLFTYPWLILIRGGWYQLFSIAKAAQVLLVLVFMLALVRWLGGRIRGDMSRPSPY